jgi:hypothetical protein
LAQVSFSGLDIAGTLDVLDLHGRVLATTRLDRDALPISVDLSSHPPGLYIARVVLEDGRSALTAITHAR